VPRCSEVQPSVPATPSVTALRRPRSSRTPLSEGVRNIAAGASAIDLKRGLDRATRVAIEALRAQSRPVQSEREKQQVATISAHNDPTIGELVARAIEKVGAEGAVTVEEANGISANERHQTATAR
jgi:chaperonin GroEL (HSP60 family)